MKKRAVGYLRVSTEEQSDGWSLDGQEEQIREFAEKHGFELVGTYRDESSGTKERRPGFEKMLDAAQAGRFDAIVVVHTSRLFRNIGLARRYKEELRDRLGIEVLFVNQPIIDPSDPLAFIMEGINELFDEYYVHQLRFWTRMGKRTRARKGLWNGTLPFGYETGEDGVPIPHRKNADGLRMAFEAYSTGRYSDKEIAELPNRNGFRTSGNFGERPFTKDTINRLLKNEFYLGVTKYKDERIPGQHEPLVSDSLFKRCQEVRSSRRSRSRGIGRKKGVYLFAGLARCSECGLTLRCQATSSKGGWRYYRHSARARGYSCSVPGKMIRADALEEQWTNIVSEIALPTDWRQRIEELAGDDGERRAIIAERGEIEERLRRLARLYQDLLIDDAEYRASRESLQGRLESLVLPDNPRVIEAGDYLERIGDLWSLASLKERRDITRIMLRSVIVDVMDTRIVAIEPVAAFHLLLSEICDEMRVDIANKKSQSS